MTNEPSKTGLPMAGVKCASCGADMSVWDGMPGAVQAIWCTCGAAHLPQGDDPRCAQATREALSNLLREVDGAGHDGKS